MWPLLVLCSQMLIYAVFKTNHFGSGSFFITQRTRTVIFTKVMASWRKTLSLFLSTSSLITLQQAIVLFHLKWKRTTWFKYKNNFNKCFITTKTQISWKCSSPLNTEKTYGGLYPDQHSFNLQLCLSAINNIKNGR